MLPVFLHQPLSAGYVLVGLLSCGPAPVPALSVEFRNNPPHVINSYSTEALMSLRQQASSPTYGGEFPHLDGLTKSEFSFETDMGFTEIIRPLLRIACVQVKSARLVINYTPMVYVGSHAAPGSCRHRMTLEHELRHVRTDADAVNEFIPVFKKALANAIAQNNTAEPIDMGKQGGVRKKISETLGRAIKEATDRFQQVRAARQKQVDTHAEYTRLSRACAGERR
jgi:hypothetical protein